MERVESMRTLLVGAACCLSASACAILRGTPLPQPCGVGEDVVVSNQSLEWIRVYTATKIGGGGDPGPAGIVTQLGTLAPGEEATYSPDATVRLGIIPVDRPRELNGKLRIPKDIFISCLEPIA